MSDSLHRTEGRLEDRRLEWLRNTVCESLSVDAALFDDMLDVDDHKFSGEIRRFFDAERPDPAMLAYVTELEDDTHATKGKGGAQPPPNQERAQKSAEDADNGITGSPGELVMRVAFADFPENITEVP